MAQHIPVAAVVPPTSGAAMPDDAVQAPVVQKLKTFIETLSNSSQRDDLKLRALQEISDNFEVIMTLRQQAAFVDSMIRVFIRLLQETTPQFIGENNTQQLRKLMLEMTHRMPCNEHLKQFAKTITAILFKLVETENEENVLVCLRILIEHLKQFRGYFPFTQEVRQFINFVKNVYRDLPQNLNRIFDPKPKIMVSDISELNIHDYLNDAFTVTPITTDQRLPDGTNIVYTLLPRGSASLKVLAELPISVVLLYQLYKQDVQQDLVEFIPLVLNAIILYPQRPDFSQEVFLEFLSAQIKTLSFLAYIVRIYPEHVAQHEQFLVRGTLQMLRSCPPESASLRKELLIASRHILLTELRSKFVPVIPQLFEEKLLLGSGWTAYDGLRALACSTLADLVHHVRQQLPIQTLVASINVFSRHVHDSTIPCSIQTICCKLLLNLVECIIKSDLQNARDLLFQMLEVFVRKFKIIAYEQLALLNEKADAAAAEISASSTAAANSSFVSSAPSASSAASQTAAASTEASTPAPPAGLTSQGSTASLEAMADAPSGLMNSSTASADETSAASAIACGSGSDAESSKLNTSAVTTATTEKDESKLQYGFPNPFAAYQLNDCRGLVKTLVCGAKTIAWGLNSVASSDPTFSQQKFLLPKETDLFHRLMKYGLKALDVYTFTAGPQPNTFQRTSSSTPVRTKEEKEVLEHFAGIFTLMNHLNFKEMITVHIDYIITRIGENYALQIIPNSFLSNNNINSAFAAILMDYLLNRMEEMGRNAERSNLFLKLFKLLFGSVQVYPPDNEQMLKALRASLIFLQPNLHRLVNRSVEYALSAKEPYNYFLLLRALFRSIGGGSHDLLYQEFLPLLPSMLQSLNSLQSGKHRQQMKEVFVELCLTVPVRLSSLLPYLPMLMDPLVSALHGSPTLIAQGLRTLELCVDNLQPDFLFDHIAPVRAPLMEALWRTVSCGSDQAALNAFRILGKFGGANRKMLMEPSKLNYQELCMDTPTMPFCFDDEAFGNKQSIVELSIWQAVETATKYLRISDADLRIRQVSWRFLKAIILAYVNTKSRESVLADADHGQKEAKSSVSMFSAPSAEVLQSVRESNSGLVLEELEKTFENLSSKTPSVEERIYKCSDAQSRRLISTALGGMFDAMTTKDLCNDVQPTLTAVCRHIALLAIKQSYGSGPIRDFEHYKLTHMDVVVFVDAIVVALGGEDKDLCDTAILAIRTIRDSAALVLGSKELACDLPLFRYLGEEASSLCFKQAWFAKLGGCIAIKYFVQSFSRKWILAMAVAMFRGLLHSMADLVVEISNGCIEMARDNVFLLIKTVLSKSSFDPPADVDLESSFDPLETSSAIGGNESDGGAAAAIEQTSSIDAKRNDVIAAICRICVQNVGCCCKNLRDCALEVLNMISKHSKKQMGVLLQPFSADLDGLMVPVDCSLKQMSIPAQIACLESIAFGLMLRPSVVRFDLEFGPQKDLQVRVLNDIVSICEADENQLKADAAKGTTMSDVMALKCSALKALFACKDSKFNRVVIFQVLFKSLLSDAVELQEVAYQCMEKYLTEFKPEEGLIRDLMRPLLLLLSDYKCFTLSAAKKLSNLTRVFPTTFNEKLCDPLLSHLKKWMECASVSQQTQSGKGGGNAFVTTEMELCAVIIEIFHQIPATPPRFVEHLISLIAHTEASMFIDKGSVWREPLLKFVVRFPADTVQFCLQESSLKEFCVANLFEWFLKHPKGIVFRDELRNNTEPVLNLLHGNVFSGQAIVQSMQIPGERLCNLGISIAGLLAKEKWSWLIASTDVRPRLRNLWTSQEFRNRLTEDGLEEAKWKIPKILVSCLLAEFKNDPQNVELLFDVMYCFTARFLTNFTFVRVFCEKEIAQTYSVQWKRNVFLCFFNCFYHDQTKSVDLKLKIVQHLIIPCVQSIFERGESDEFIGTPPAPDVESSENLVSVFVQAAVDGAQAQQLPDGLRILLSQLSCLFVEHSPAHIHDVNSKKQGNRLRQFMLFAWPNLQTNVSIDPTARYHGHLLIAHIISKFAINRKIVLQVFHSLMKAHHQEAKSVVRQALNILTPAVPARMDDGHLQLQLFAKRLLVEEGHTVSQLTHVLQNIVRHHKVYYCVRAQLIVQVVTAMQRLGFAAQAGNDNRRLSLDLAETIIKWEMNRVQISQLPVEQQPKTTVPDENNPLDQVHTDNVINFLIRLACQAADQTGSTVETISKRCLNLIKAALKPELWGLTADLKLAWIEKILLSAEQVPSVAPICTVMEVLTYVIGVLPPDRVFELMRQLLQSGIQSCINNSNAKILKCLYALLTKLLAVLNPEANAAAGHSWEQLESLSGAILKSIHEGLSNYEKAATSTPSHLFPALTLLKVMSGNQPTYIERNVILTPFLKVLQKLSRDHIGLPSSATSETSQPLADLVVLSLQLAAMCVPRMSTEQRRLFANVISPLVEKSNSPKVIEQIIKIADEWMRSTDRSTTTSFQKDKQQLLVSLMVCLEHRFADKTDLLMQFLETVIFVYRCPAYKNQELAMKLEPAFMVGLRIANPELRAKFFETYNESIRKKPFDRLFYILCIQDWKSMGTHYWIKHCVELMLAISDQSKPAVVTNGAKFAALVVPPKIDDQAINAMQFGTVVTTDLKTEPTDASEDARNIPSASVGAAPDPALVVKQTLRKHHEFLVACDTSNCADLTSALIELCHYSADLAGSVWIDLVAKIWPTLSEKQRELLQNEINPFLCSGVHLSSNRQSQSTVLKTFVDAFAKCNPPVCIKPPILRYLGQGQQIWHRAVLLLEQIGYADLAPTMKVFTSSQDQVVPHQVVDATGLTDRMEALGALAELYATLNDGDMATTALLKSAKYPETVSALQSAQYGLFEQSQLIVEQAMPRVQSELAKSGGNLSLIPEFKRWEAHWVRCTQELNQWDILADFGATKTVNDSFVLVDAAWRMSNWRLMKDAVASIEKSCPRDMLWKLNLYKGYVSVYHTDDQQQLTSNEKFYEQASLAAIKDWRRLPAVICSAHSPILQASQLVVELQEATNVQPSAQMSQHQLSAKSFNMQDVKTVVKTWRNRLPTISDSLTYWSHVLAWRQHFYGSLVSIPDAVNQQAPANPIDLQSQQQHSLSLIGAQASAQSMLQFAKIARKHQLPNVALEILQKLQGTGYLTGGTAYQKMRQHVKCLIRPNPDQKDLTEALELVESFDLSLVTATSTTHTVKEVTADVLALKGSILSGLGRLEEANKMFSAAVQTNENSLKSWAVWGEHIEQTFSKERLPEHATHAILCYLEAARLPTEAKARKLIARILALLKQEDGLRSSSIAEAFAKRGTDIPTSNWIIWIPQLLNHLEETGNATVHTILCNVARSHPQALFWHLNCIDPQAKSLRRKMTPLSGDFRADGSDAQSSVADFPTQIRAVWAAMEETNVVSVVALRKLLSSFNSFREHWAEFAMRRMVEFRRLCNSLAFEQRSGVENASVDDSTRNFISALIEQLRLRSETADAADGLLKKAVERLRIDFDWSVDHNKKLHKTIAKLTRWIRVFEAKVLLLPKSFNLHDEAPFLSTFSTRVGDIELPGELFTPKLLPYCTRITKFLPRVDLIQKFGVSARRINIRGHNGRTYRFLLLRYSDLFLPARRQRVLQLLRMLNAVFTKYQETTSRLLQFNVPHVLALNNELLLVADNSTSLEFLSILQEQCSKTHPEDLVSRYYEQLLAAERNASGPAQIEQLRKAAITETVDCCSLTKWMQRNCPDATDYVVCRKQFANHLSLIDMAEYVFYLSATGLEDLVLLRDTGALQPCSFTFDINSESGCLDVVRPVPFRLTPCIANYLGPCISGSVTPAMTASVRALSRANIGPFLRPILWDEFVEHFNESRKTLPSNEQIDAAVSKAVSSITSRLQSLSALEVHDGKDSRIALLVAAASNTDNLYRMDPAWHPWF